MVAYFGNVQPQLLGVLGLMVNICGVQKCFGGDTPPIQTSAAYVPVFDYDGFKTQLSRTDSGYISAGSCTDYRQLIMIHLFSPPSACCEPFRSSVCRSEIIVAYCGVCAKGDNASATRENEKGRSRK